MKNPSLAILFLVLLVNSSSSGTAVASAAPRDVAELPPQGSRRALAQTAGNNSSETSSSSSDVGLLGGNINTTSSSSSNNVSSNTTPPDSAGAVGSSGGAAADQAAAESPPTPPPAASRRAASTSSRAGGSSVGPSYRVPPGELRYARINFADPPDASAPAPARVWAAAEAGLSAREYRERPPVSNLAAAFARARAAAAEANRTGALRRGAAAAAPRGAALGGGARRLPRVVGGFDGIGAPEANVIPEDLGLAVGRSAAIHSANSLLRFYAIAGGGGGHGRKAAAAPAAASPAALIKQVWLPDFFYAVTRRGDGADGCDEGVFASALAYDKAAGRFLIAAICGDVALPKVLLAVSATTSVTGYWHLYSAPADNLPTSWKCSNGERALPDFSQLGYNGDGVFVTWVAICREGVDQNQIQSGAMLYAFPKWAIYGGADPSLDAQQRFYVPVYTGQDLCESVRNQKPSVLPPGGDCGASFTQLQPAAPQSARDVGRGATFFVVDFWLDQLSRRRFVLAALVGTDALWDSRAAASPAPAIAGRFVDRGQDAYLNDDAYLRQNQAIVPGAPDLDAGAVNPRGYWSGGAALAGGLVYLADRTDVADLNALYSPRPAVYWAWVQPGFAAGARCGGKRRRLLAAANAGGARQSRRLQQQQQQPAQAGARREPNLVYTTAREDVDAALRAQAPAASTVTVGAEPPPEQAGTSSFGNSTGSGGQRAIGCGGGDAAAPATLLATVVKSGVITYGSGSGEADAPLGLAYPSVAVRGRGAMLVTFTYASYADLAPLPGTKYANAPAYPGVGYTSISASTRVTQVAVAAQPDPSYGPVLQLGQRFGDTGSAIDIHPTTGRVWSANLFTWAPAAAVDGATVRSNTGARISIFA